MILAGRRPAGVLAGIASVDDPMSMAHGDELRCFADRHDLALVSVADLAEYRRRGHTVVKEAASARLPLVQGEFTAVGYRNPGDGREHLALVFGDIGDGLDVVVGVHSECQIGDVFGSLQYRCASHLDLALSTIAREGRGVLLYIRSGGGAGSGLLAALTAHEHGRAGCGTDASLRPEELGESPDYLAGTSILVALGVRTLRLLGDDRVRAVGPRQRESDAGAVAAAAVRTQLTCASCPVAPPVLREGNDKGRRAVRVATGTPV
jgi:3,4-dihydroxy 2-butanone 4-phosphate synthase/GTP cyclohydrolase II